MLATMADEGLVLRLPLNQGGENPPGNGAGSDEAGQGAGPTAELDVSAAAPSLCSGGAITLIDEDETKITLEGVSVSGASSEGCNVSGTMRIELPGNNVTATTQGRIDRYNYFYSSSIGPVKFNIAGLTLSSQWNEFKKDTFRLMSPYLGAPKALGGGSIPLMKPPTITEEGLEFEDGVSTDPINMARDAGLKIPELKLENGITLGGLSGSLKINSTGFGISASGQFGIPGLKAPLTKGKNDCYIKANFEIFVNGAGTMVIKVEPPDKPEPVEIALPGPQTSDAISCDERGNCPLNLPICLSQVGLGMGCTPGIPLDAVPAKGPPVIFLTEVSGQITLRQDDVSIDLGVTIATSTAQFLGQPALSVEGNARLKVYPELEVALQAALKAWILEAASASAKYSASGGLEVSATIRDPNFPLWRYEGTIRVWGTGPSNYLYSTGKVNVTGSGRSWLGLKQGEIFNQCIQVPCGIQYCTSTVWYYWWGWHSYQATYPCGTNWCNSCITVPPYEIWLAGMGSDFGNFVGDLVGLKGYVKFWEYTTGFFVNFQNGKLAFGDVSQYQLVRSDEAMQAKQRWDAVQRGEIPAGKANLDPRFSFPSDGSIIVSAANIAAKGEDPAKSSPLWATYDGVGARDVRDAITTTNVISKTDTAFTVSASEAITVSLITPPDMVPAAFAGVEITPDNYTTFSPTLKIAYREYLTFTTSAKDQTRWRYMTASLDPALDLVDVKLDGQPVFANVDSSTGYTPISVGSHTVEIVPSGQSAPVLVATLNVVAGTDYTVLTLNGAAGTETWVVTDNNQPPASLDQGKVRVVNLVSNVASTVDVKLNALVLGDNLAAKNTGPYQQVAPGEYMVEVLDASNNTQIMTSSLVIDKGSIYTIVASDRISETVLPDGSHPTDITLFGLQDAMYPAMTQREYIVDQAPIGDWQVKLTGPVTETGWTLAVFGPPNPPIISNLTVDPTNLAATNVAMYLQSDHAPTRLTFFVTQAPITQTVTITDNEGIPSTSDIPYFSGEAVDAIAITHRSLLDGSQMIIHQVDLSYLESGEYYLWVQVEDGVSPAVNQYAALSLMAGTFGARTVNVAAAEFQPRTLTDGAGKILVDQTDWFEGHFAKSQITPELHVEVWDWEPCAPPIASDCEQVEDEWGRWVFSDYMPLYYKWDPSYHPDVDGYIVYIDALDSDLVTSTQVFTVGDSIYQFYDDNNQPTGDPVGAYGWREVFPDETYSIVVGAYDQDTGRVDKSAPVKVTVPLGTLDLTSLSPLVWVKPGGSGNGQLHITLSEDLFYDADLVMDLENFPPGLDANFVGDSGQTANSALVSPRGRLAPLDATRAQTKISIKTPRIAEGAPSARAARADYQEDIGIVVTALAEVPYGSYTLPFVATSGPISRTAEITIFVGDDMPHYLPIISKN
jgi:hypothetical protein